MKLIHKLDIRSVCCTLCCICRYLYVCFLLPASWPFLSRPDSLKLDRRRGFSNYATAAMFVATMINFLLSSLYIGSHVAGFIVFIRKALILDIDYSPSEKAESINNTLWNVISGWAEILPVSVKLFPPDPVSQLSMSREILLGDFIVIWRAWVLFPERQWVVFIPFILWIGTVGE